MLHPVVFSRAGTWIASAVWVTCLHACLVSDPIDLGEPVNHRPSILARTDAVNSTQGILTIDLASPELPAEVTLEVTIRDANLLDDVNYRVLVDGANFGEGVARPVQGATDEPGSAEQREVDILVPIERELAETGCHRIDVGVTKAFANFSLARPFDTLEPGDFGLASWFVRTIDADRPLVNLQMCPPPLR